MAQRSTTTRRVRRKKPKEEEDDIRPPDRAKTDCLLPPLPHVTPRYDNDLELELALQLSLEEHRQSERPKIQLDPNDFTEDARKDWGLYRSRWKLWESAVPEHHREYYSAVYDWILVFAVEKSSYETQQSMSTMIPYLSHLFSVNGEFREFLRVYLPPKLAPVQDTMHKYI